MKRLFWLMVFGGLAYVAYERLQTTQMATVSTLPKLTQEQLDEAKKFTDTSPEAVKKIENQMLAVDPKESSQSTGN